MHLHENNHRQLNTMKRLRVTSEYNNKTVIYVLRDSQVKWWKNVCDVIYEGLTMTKENDTFDINIRKCFLEIFNDICENNSMSHFSNLIGKASYHVLRINLTDMFTINDMVNCDTSHFSHLDYKHNYENALSTQNENKIITYDSDEYMNNIENVTQIPYLCTLNAIQTYNLYNDYISFYRYCTFIKTFDEDSERLCIDFYHNNLINVSSVDIFKSFFPVDAIDEIMKKQIIKTNDKYIGLFDKLIDTNVWFKKLFDDYENTIINKLVNDAIILSDIPNHFRNERIHNIAIDINPKNIFWMSRKYKNYDELCLKAVYMNSETLKYIENPRKQLLHKMIENDVKVITTILDLSFDFTHDMFNIAFSKDPFVTLLDGRLLKYTNDKQMIYDTLAKNPLAIQYVKNPTIEMCMMAIKQNVDALNHIFFQTYDMVIEGVKISPIALKYMSLYSKASIPCKYGYIYSDDGDEIINDDIDIFDIKPYVDSKNKCNCCNCNERYNSTMKIYKEAISINKQSAKYMKRRYHTKELLLLLK